MNDFSEKYRPTVVSDVIGNKNQIAQIKQWLQNYEKNKTRFLEEPKKRNKKKVIKIDIKDGTENENVDICEETDVQQKINKSNKSNSDLHSCLMIIGDHGVGKTCTVMTILKQMKYIIQTFDITKLGSNKTIMESINKLTRSRNIYDNINEEHNKIVMVFDEVESANNQVEKNFILNILKKNEENWFFPIIFISNGHHSKLNTTIGDNSNKVVFFQPSNENLMKLLLSICYKEKIKFESEEVGNEVIKHSQCDFRRLVLMLQDLKTMYCNSKKENIISGDCFSDYCNSIKKKDANMEIYRSTAHMMVNYQGIDNCLKVFEADKVIIPLVMHQNYIKCIVNNHPIGVKKFKLISTISKIIAFGDLVDNYVFSDQNWDLQEVHGFLTCVNPSFLITNEKINVNEEYLKLTFNFPYDLHKTSIRQINKKNIVNSNNCLKNFKISDFIIANRLIRKLIVDNKITECANLFKKYSAKVENIESILKIDKINESKTTIPTQIKKKINEILNKK